MRSLQPRRYKFVQQKVGKKLAKSWQKVSICSKSWQKVGKKLAKSWQKRCHILVSGLHCLTYSALNDLISIKSGTGVGGQKVLSRPSADSFAVGRRQKGHLHNPVKNNNRPRSDQLRQYREVEKILGIIRPPASP
jgi:hypothetical protein